MIYLIKFVFFLLINNYAFANENNTNQILFKINKKVFTNIDLDERREYVALINNFQSSNFSQSENDEILNDYISSLIFYEYYNQKKISYKNLNEEIELIYQKNLKDSKESNLINIKTFKFNTKIDLVRNKIIEEKLNSNKSSLLQEVDRRDLLYNYNLQNIIIKKNLIDQDLIKNIDNIEKFNNLKRLLKINKINFFYKEKDITNDTAISSTIKNIIHQDKQIYINYENEYINLILIKKNLESYEGVYVKLMNFQSSKPIKKSDLKCDKINETIDISKTVFQEYEYSKLNNNIKNNLKSINDYIQFNENNEYNYIILCDLTYNENLLKNINFNKNVDSLVNKIQNQFLKKYKNEYKFTKIK